MSLITRCPACETLFKVVPDQLRISEGWVRCGQCDEAFDAAAQLVKDVPPEPQSVPVQIAEPQAPEPISEPQLSSTTQVETPVAKPQFLELDLDFSDINIESIESPRLVLDFGGEPPSLDTNQGVAGSLEPEVLALDADTQAPEVKAEIETETETKNAAATETHSTSLADISFVRTQSAKSAWHKPLVRMGLSVLVLLMLLILAGQIVFHERDRLVAHEPRLSPWLSAFCVKLGCSISPVQRIESVVIESSSFARVRGETYVLSFRLKNTSVTPLAMPAVELTLTDALDQPVLRRVVLLEELDATPGTLDPGLARSLAATFLVKLDAKSQQMAGYRLLAFYP